MSYNDYSTPWDDECDCQVAEERNRFQSALDEIAVLLDGVTATNITDEILDQIRAEADKR